MGFSDTVRSLLCIDEASLYTVILHCLPFLARKKKGHLEATPEGRRKLDANLRH